MIYGIHNFLNGKTNLPFGERVGFKNLYILFVVILWLGFTERISFGLGVIIALSFMLLSTNLLVVPYLYLWNITSIKINKKFFKKRVFIYRRGRKIKFSKNKGNKLYFDSPIGIVLGDRVYLNDDSFIFPDNIPIEGINYIKKHYGANYMKDFDGFIEEIDGKDDISTINRKAIIFVLE